MKPLGRKYYKNKTGGKHHIRVNGKFICWWQDVCQPSKSLESRIEKEEIEAGKDEYYEEEIKMNRSKGNYIQGLKYAESLLEKSLEAGEDPSERFRQIFCTGIEPSYYYDGKDYCDGFYDYIHYYINNKELIVNHFKGE